ncbi:AI-2E family transporter [Candidatus Raskinella chloraquaticus]
MMNSSGDREGMSQQRLWFWLGMAALFVGAVYLLRDMLLPFVAALVLAYMLNPVANWLSRLGLSRTLAALFILSIFLVVFIVVLIVVIPLIATQFAAFIGALPGYVSALHGFAMRRLEEMNDNPIAAYIVGRMGGSGQDISQLVSQGAGWIGRFLGSLWSGGQALVSILSLIVVTPIVAFYILVDWPHMLASLDSILPRRSAATIRLLASDMDKVIASFIRGQAWVCLALGLFYGISLTALGLNFGLIIGLGAGALSFIPYFGTLVGCLTAFGIGVVQFWPDWVMLTLMGFIFVSGHLFDGYVLQPRIVGASVGLHPVWLMFALFAFGSLLGFVGLLLAVPLAASIGVLIRFAIMRYRQSDLFEPETAA